MIKSFATTHQLLNLFNNGAFEYGGTKLHFWTVIGDDVLRGNSYSRSSEDSKNYLVIDLSSNQPLILFQEFGDAVKLPMDFEQGTRRESLATGYDVPEAKMLPHGVEYTLSFSARVRAGAVTITPHILDLNAESGASLLTVTYTDGIDSIELSRTPIWRRHTFKFVTSHSMYQAGLSILRSGSDNTSLIDITDISLVIGSYDVAPYTGDPLMRVLPKGCIVMVLGDTCPEGFEAVATEGFTRSGDNRGGDIHTAQDNTTLIARSSTIEFEGYQSKAFVSQLKVGGQYIFDANNNNDPVDVPDEKGAPSHKHKIEDSASIPVGILMKFCERV